MVLQKQKIEIPIVGGVNDKNSDLLSNQPLSIVNGVYRKNNELSKRYGYTAIGQYNTATNASPIPNPEILTTYENELLRIGQSKIHSYFTEKANCDWIDKGNIPEAKISFERISSGESTSYDPTICSNSDYQVILYSCFETSGSSNFNIYCDVIKISTNTKIINKQLLDSNTNAIGCKILYVNNRFWLFWRSSTVVKYSTFTPETLLITSATNLVSSYTGSIFDVASNGTYITIVYKIQVSTNYLLQVINYSISGSTLSVRGSQVGTAYAVATYDFTSIALDYVGNQISTIYCLNNASTNYYVYADIFTDVSGTITTPGTLLVQSNVFSDEIYSNCSITNLTGTSSYLCVWSRDSTTNPRTYRGTYWREIVAGVSGPTFASSEQKCLQTKALSKPFIKNSQVYLFLQNLHSTHSTLFLCCIETSLLVNLTNQNNNVRMVGVSAVRQMPYDRQYLVSGQVSAVATSNSYTSKVFFAAITNGEVIKERDNVSIFTIDFDLQKRYAIENNKNLVIGGGVVSCYDNSHAFEVGFAYEPDAMIINGASRASDNSISITGGQSTGGDLTTTGTYLYKFLYEWYDSKGKRYQSTTSEQVKIVLTGSNNKVTLYIPNLQITNKCFSSDTNKHKIQLVAYRTKTLGSVFYRIPNQLLYSEVGTATSTFVDTASDISIESQEILYTDGNVLDNVIPTSSTIVHFHKNAVFLAGTDDDSIWISKEILPGEGIAFNDTITIPSFEGGRITGLASLFESLIIFKENSIWLVAGDPPNNLGQSNLSIPQRIQTNLGCTDPKSIVSTSEGIFFYSNTAGITLLNPSQQIIAIGKNVESSIKTIPNFVGAYKIPKQDKIRFVQYAASSADVLNYDTYQTQILGNFVWTIDNLTDPVHSSTVGNVYAATIFNSDFVWIGGTNNSTLYKEDTTTYLDTGAGNTNYVSFGFTSAFEKLTTLFGHHRIYNIGFVGTKLNNHGISIVLTSNLGLETKSFTYTEINSLQDLVYNKERILIKPANQKISWMKMNISDTDPGAGNRGIGEGFKLQSIIIEIGSKEGMSKISAAGKK